MRIKMTSISKYILETANYAKVKQHK